MLQERHKKNLRVLVDRGSMYQLLPQNGIVCELGVLRGDNAKKIIANAKPKKLYLADAWISLEEEEKMVREAFAKGIESGSVIVLKGRSPNVISRIPDHTLDWIYIDTDHSYELTTKELQVAAVKVKPGGFICGHDYVIGDMRNPSKPALFGVIDAVNQFCVKNNWELIYLTNEFHGKSTCVVPSFAIRKIK